MATKESNPVLPLPFQRGQALKAADLEMLRTSIAFALDGMIGAGPGLLIAKRGSKWIISAERTGNSVSHTFKLSGFIDTGPVAKITITPGMVNNFVPTIGGVSLVAVPAPAITVTGASGIIQLKATVDGAGAVTALIAESVAGPSVTTDTATLKYKLVGTWTASGGAFTSVNPILNTNQTLYPCNGTAIWES